jgi:1-acyl-sn-glycerol-3-phosphate acyltransferase
VNAPAPRPSPLYRFVATATRPLLERVFRLRASGLENLPVEGGYVLAANHCSNFDPWPLGMPLFPQRHLRFMAKSELFWPPLGWVIDAGGGFPVRRGERDEEAIATAVRLCREGHVVAMFPEGTRRAKGLVKKHEARWRTGAARIALEAQVPLVPAAIFGTDRLAKLPRLEVAYGAPIALDDLPDTDVHRASVEATRRLQEWIETMELSLAAGRSEDA